MTASPMKVGAIGALAFLGMIDTLYLSISRRSGPIPCHITSGCEDVVTSVYSTVAGIPIAWFGLAFYLTVFGAAVFEGSGNTGSIRLLLWPATLALIASATLTGIQAFVLEAYCEYCLGSAALSTGIFGSSAEFVGKTVFHRRLRRPRCSPSLKASLASSAAAPALTLGCAPRCRLVWAMGNGASGGGSGHRV